jgi:hypothetical protein
MGAVSCDRIAGYLQSSLLGLAGQEFNAIKQVRIACNTEVNPADVRAIRSQRQIELNVIITCQSFYGSRGNISRLLEESLAPSEGGLTFAVRYVQPSNS